MEIKHAGIRGKDSVHWYTTLCQALEERFQPHRRLSLRNSDLIIVLDE